MAWVVIIITVTVDFMTSVIIIILGAKGHV